MDMDGFLEAEAGGQYTKNWNIVATTANTYTYVLNKSV